MKKKTLKVLFFAFFSFFIICSCEQPFRAGLGPVVDTRPPTITLTSPGAGDYIFGSKLFKGTAEDDYKLDRVQIRVTNHPDIEYLRNYRSINLAKDEKNKRYVWQVEIDTTQFPDGDFKIQLLAVDSMNKTAETNEIAFYIKNNPPAINVAAPLIIRGEMDAEKEPNQDYDGQVGGWHLNYRTVDVLDAGINYRRRMDKGSFLSGTISDDEDIYTGPEDREHNRYPPQIRFWRVSGVDSEDSGYRPGELPSEDMVPWKNFTINTDLFMLGIGNYQFTYDLPAESERYYGFEIRAQNRDGRSHFHYPRDFYDPDIKWDDMSDNAEFKMENRYVLIYLRAPTELPVVDIYGLEDLPRYWETGNYETIQENGAALNDNQAHRYVNRLAVNKNGPFTLRIKAVHTEGISSAEVYWEKDDKKTRGRFIWDLANEPPSGVTNWQNVNNARADLPYSSWGYRDPHSFSAADGFYTTRTFIFTYQPEDYRPGGNYTVPSGGEYHPQVRGRSKVQRYTGVDDQKWKEGKAGGQWPLAEIAGSLWEDVNVPLAEGVYTIEVYARSTYGTPLTIPFSCSIQLDSTPPDVEVTGIEGAYEHNGLKDGFDVYTVNGVIKPRLLFSDSRPEDSGLRMATGDSYHLRPGTTDQYGYEQRYILTDSTNRSILDGIIKSAKNWWPSDTIAGVTAARQGPVFDSVCTFLTSPIYDTPLSGSVNQPLPDGDYYLYVFARDNAFNVGYNSKNPLKIIVEAETDRPKIDFSVGSIKGVKDPNVSADGTPQGFIHDGVTRNKLTGGSSIRLYIKDDDSLDLGTSAADGNEPAGVQISFTGSYQNGDAVTAWSDVNADYRIDLTAAQIKEIFTPQSLSGGERRAVTSRQGEIRQDMLLTALKANDHYDDLFGGADKKDQFTSLPDGIYRVNIRIKDYRPLKMKLSPSHNDPEVASADDWFWIVVDSRPPSYTLDPSSSKAGAYITTGEIFGTVEDKNGPVTMECKVIDGTTPDDIGKIIFTGKPLERTGDPDMWTAAFSADVDMSAASGTFTFQITFTDRFGNTRILTQKLQVDTEPPEVTLGREITVFERDYPDVDYSGITRDDKKILANGVVRFRIAASDNGKVTEIKWWLRPAAAGVPGYNDAVDNVTSRRLDSGFSAWQYIDTGALNGRYTLYVMGKDDAGNISVLADNSRQTIFLLQEQDRPYFGYWDGTAEYPGPLITPSEDTVTDDATVRGEIYDDDGFVDADNKILSGSVSIWMSASPGAASVDVDNDLSLSAWGFGTPAIYGAGSFTGASLTPSQRGVIEMKADLQAIFGMKTNGDDDGLKYYIIEAQDSHIGKFNDDTGAPGETSDRVTRRKLFSFIYDTQVPKISLTYPDTAIKTFGPNANNSDYPTVNFRLEGDIKDANLKQTEDGYYYFYYYLDSGERKLFKLIPGPDITVTPGGGSPAAEVHFTVTAERFCQELQFMTGAVTADVTHTITFVAQDRGGKENVCSFNFIKDLNPPVLTFTNPAVANPDTIRLPEVAYAGSDRDWWWVTTEQDWYRARHDKLETMAELPVITYARGNSTPQLKVTFDDVTSNIATELRYWIDNETGARTITYAGGSKSYSWTIDLTKTPGGANLDDGVHSIRFEIADVVGNTLSSTDGDNKPLYYGFRINSGAPQIQLNPIAHDVYGVVTTVNTDTFFTADGEARGPNLKEGQLIIRYMGTPSNPQTVTLQDTGDNWSFNAVTNDEVINWTYNVTRQNLMNAAGGTLKEGSYQLELRARGRDNALSDPPVIWPFTIDTSPIDSAKLSVSEWTPRTDTNVHPHNLTTAAQGRKVFTTDSGRIQATVSDAQSNLTTVRLSIQRYNYTNGSWENFYTATGEGTGNWDADSEVWNEILSGETTKEKVVNWTLNSIQNLNDGLYRFRLRAKDSAYVNGTSAETWTTPPAADGNPYTSGYYYFFYAPGNPSISFTDEAALCSAAAAGGTLTFTGTAAGSGANGNGYQKIDVEIKKGGAVYGSPVSINWTVPAAGGSWNDGWNWSAALSFPTAPVDDGSWQLTFTVTDWAGKSASQSRVITLDNTPPTGKFTTPELLPDAIRNTQVGGKKIYENGSETFYGGDVDSSVMAGTAEDSSGLAGIWYHLGYIGNGVAGTPLAFPTKEQIINSVLGTTTDAGGTANNAAFDAEAAKTASDKAWFKYDTSYPNPPHFDSPSGTFYDWKLEVSSAQNLSLNYAKTDLTVKGQTYNAADSSGYGAGRRMTQRIDETGLPVTYKKNNGLYSLPLWVRVADEAGNVSYFCQDIWLYPNGDYPTNAITNPTEKIVDQNRSRGGTVPFDGIASDNVNVKTVIYRIRADDKQSTVTGWNTDAPPASQIIRPSIASGAQPFTSSTGGWDVFTGSQNSAPSDTDGWYMATLEGGDAAAKNKAWSFYVNADNEFTTKGADDKTPIERWGFTVSGAAMIRVYVEVLVFDGDPANNYHFMSLGENNAGTQAKPDVVIFYLSATAPVISDMKISEVGTFNNNTVTPANAAYHDYTKGRTRSDKFAVRMALNGGGKNIGQVQVRLPSEARAGGNMALATEWRDAWNSANGNRNLPGVTFNPASPPSSTGSFTMTYAFTTTAAAVTGFAPVMQGNWAASGGQYLIEVRLRDTADPPGEVTFQFDLGIDNFAPVADKTHIRSNPKVAGSNQTFMGRAYDYYTQGSNTEPGYYSVEKVYAWFTKDIGGEDRYINLNTLWSTPDHTAPSSALTRTTIPAWKGRAADGLDVDTVTSITLNSEGSLVNCNYPAPAVVDGRETSNQWVKVISEAEAAQLANKMNWQPITTGRSVLWSFMTDTTVMPDGPLYLNYIVVDGAGNASLYQQNMVVMNHYPVITDLTLYTDNTGQGAVFTTHETNEASSDYKVPLSMPAGYLNSGFISKNKYIGFKVTTASGNPPLHYRVQYVKRRTENLTLENLTKMANQSWGDGTVNLYTIANKASMDDNVWARLMDVPKVTAANGMHFVFKASAADVAGMSQYGTTTVYCYTQVPDLCREKTNQGAIIDDKTFTTPGDKGFRFETDDFGTTTDQINELNGSHPNNEGGADEPAQTAFFLIKVWDTVNDIQPGQSGYNEDDMLYDALVVGMNVYLSDKERPAARLYDLNPYTEIAVTGNNIGSANQAATISKAADPVAVGSNIIRGGLFNTKIERDLVKSGYIEPRNGSFALTPVNSKGLPLPDYPLRVEGDQVATGGDTRDKVSGRIILRGLAWDDQLIDEIWIKIGSDAAKCILKLNMTTGTMDAYDNHPAFAAEELHWKTGHTVEWAYVWDTEQAPSGRTGGGPLTDVAVQVYVKDKNGSGGIYTNGLFSNKETNGDDVPYITVATDDNSATFHNQVNVDIVPYITGFERETPMFTTKRSLQGWYSFYQGEANIALLGYNFGQTASNVDVILTSGAGGGTTTTITPNWDGDAENTKNRLYFTVPTTANSGKLDATVSGTAAYNHSSVHADKSWNREYNAYTPGSDLWINKPHAHIWRSTQSDTDPRTYIGRATAGTGYANATSAGLDHPGMALEYASGSNSGRLHGTWAVYGNAVPYWGNNNGDSNNIVGQTTEPYLTPDISIYNGTGTPNFGFSYQGDGAPTLYVKALTTNVAGATIQANTGTNTTQRWQNIRISKALANTSAAETNVGRIYMTAFDAPNKGLWYGIRNGTTNNTLFIDGGNATANVAGLAAAGNAGQYSAVDYDGTGPIIAYYDQTNDTVRVALGSSVTPTTAANWTRLYLLPSGNPLRRGSGKYISIKVDRANGIHLAFYNSVYNTVVYYYAASRANIGGAPGDNVKVHTIDSVLTSGGIWTDISVDNKGNPWIVYGDSSRTGNYDGVRMAYRSSSDTGFAFSGTLACPVTGADITGWEALTMPAQYTVNNDRLNIEVWPPTNRANGNASGEGTLGTAPGWNAAVGYASTLFRVAYFYYPAWKGY